MSNNKASKPMLDISIILPCHSEGLLVHRTINSITRAITHTHNRYPELTFEIIVALDKPDPETTAYFKEHPHKLFKILENNFGDAGRNRNTAIAVAQGEFIALVDGDDLVSDNWFTEAYSKAKDPTNNNTIFHPRWTVYFERENMVARHVGSDEPEFHFSNLIESNYWVALFFCKRDLLQDLKYEETSPGYAYEDWLLYCEALAKGYHVKVIEETAYYIRRKRQGSRLSQHNQDFNTLRPSKLFTKEVYNALIEQETGKSGGIVTHPSKGTLRVTLRGIKNRLYKLSGGRLNSLLGRMSDSLKKRMGITYEHQIDLSGPEFNWLIKDWKSKNAIEPMLFPEKFMLPRFHYYQVSNNFTGLIYDALLRSIPQDLDYMFIIPWLKPGGAEKVLFNYINYLYRINPEYKIAVIATQHSGAPWAHKLPKNVFHYELANNSVNLESFQRLEVLLKFLIQYPPYAIHVINSELGHQLVQKYGELLHKKSKLFCSTFCEGYSEDGKLQGLMFEYLPTSYQFFDAISTDNRRIIKKLGDIYAFKPDHFFTHYQPIVPVRRVTANSDHAAGLAPVADKTLNIVWAGRIDEQKWPELLLEISDQNRDLPVKFHVWGSTVLSEKGDYLTKLKQRPNIIYHGPFNDFLKLPLEEYDLLLYTSIFDGLPNIVLEAMAAGLPVIATGNGAVPEVIIDNKSGFLINNATDFREVILKVFDNRDLLTQAVENAEQILKQQHSEEMFIEELKAFPGYLH